MINWKLPATAAVIAIIISFISGIAGGARFGTIVLRALIGGALFGAFSLGIDILLRRFLPEIYGNNSDEDSETISSGSVDITIEEENPHVNEEEVAEPAAAEEENNDEEDIPEIAIENDAEIESEQIESDDEDENRQNDDAESEPVDVTFESQESSGYGDISSKSTVEVLGVEEDPATIAKAVRTFMNKDQ